MPSVRTVLELIRPDEIYNLVAQSSVANSFNQPAVTILRPANYVSKKVVSAAVRISKGSKEKLTPGKCGDQEGLGIRAGVYQIHVVDAAAGCTRRVRHCHE